MKKAIQILHIILVLTIIGLLIYFFNPKNARKWVDGFNSTPCDLMEQKREDERLELETKKHKLMRENFDRMYNY